MILNQTGGTACYQSILEGIYLPLCNDYTEINNQFLSPSVDLSNYFKGSKHEGHGATNGLDDEDISKITEILTQYNLAQFITIDDQKKTESHEAWVFVKVKNLELLQNFNDEISGVLTWGNSD